MALNSSTIHEFCDGSHAAFQEIYRHFFARVLRLGKKIIECDERAADYTQDFFIQVWQNRESFRNVNNFEAYFYVAARNEAVRARKAYASEFLKRDNHALVPRDTVTHNVEEYINEADYQRIISQALTTMSPQRKLIYEMSRKQGLPSREIAQKLNIAGQTVDNEITIILKAIKRHLQHHIVSILTFLSAGFIG